MKKARQMDAPVSTLQKGGEFEHSEWWREHDALLKEAWREWWQQNQPPKLPDLVTNKDRMIDPKLQQVVETLHENPTEENEQKIQDIFQTIIPNQVYQIPWFTPEGVRMIREHFDAASYYFRPNDPKSADIPTRRPNGMNRYGMILDRNVEGAVSYDGINDFIGDLADQYIRPLSRMLFPDITSRYNPEDDCETYAFTIRYQPDEDMELEEHSDGSMYTLNVNLNIVDDPKEQYDGSSLYFLDKETGEKVPMIFEPGMAVLHRGLVRHAALPIQTGERHNLVIWVFGEGGYVRFGEYPEKERLTVKERWGKGRSIKKKEHPKMEF